MAVARLQGIRVRPLFASVTGIAIAAAALAGLGLGAVTTGVYPTLGTLTLIFAFEAVVIGGLGSLWGTLIGGILIGVTQVLVSQVSVPYAMLASQLLFLLVLVVRPQGLFGTAQAAGQATGGAGVMAMKRPKVPAPPAAGPPATRGTAPVSVSRWSPAATVTTACAAVAVAARPWRRTWSGPNITQPMVTLFLLRGMGVAVEPAGRVRRDDLVRAAGLPGHRRLRALPVRAGRDQPLRGHPAGRTGRGGGGGGHLPDPAPGLSGGYFAVASWVVAECLFLYVTTQGWLGGGTGVGLQQLSSMDPVVREADTYWTALAVLVVCVGGGYLLVRSGFGLDSRATGGEPVAAAAVGVEVQRTRRLAYVLAAAGFGAIGAMLIISGLYIDPASVFSVNYSADMLFMVVIGGLGTIEGPLIGALILFAAQQVFAQYGAWYLVGIGALAIAVVLLAPGGLWGFVSGRRGWSLLPVGYRVRLPGGPRDRFPIHDQHRAARGAARGRRPVRVREPGQRPHRHHGGLRTRQRLGNAGLAARADPVPARVRGAERGPRVRAGERRTAGGPGARRLRHPEPRRGGP